MWNRTNRTRTVACSFFSGEGLVARQVSSKSGKRSSAQKGGTAHSRFQPLPKSKPVPGAFAKEGAEQVHEQEELNVDRSVRAKVKSGGGGA